MPIISPSVLAADFGNLERDMKMLEESAAEWIHIDVMDGVFVPNISFGFPVLEAICRHTSKFMDVHLMITKPERYVERFIEAGADMVTLHIEATEDAEGCIKRIHELGACAGISIKPHTAVEEIEGLIEQVDMILVMSVEPGFGGQSFMTESIDRIAKIKAMIDKIEWGNRRKPLIQVDGGVSMKNARLLYDAGADVLVAGSSVFKAADPQAEILAMLGA